MSEKPQKYKVNTPFQYGKQRYEAGDIILFSPDPRKNNFKWLDPDYRGTLVSLVK